MKEFRQLVEAGQATVLGRPNNRKTMYSLGFNNKDVLEEVKNLAFKDFVKRDFDRNHELEWVWIFKKRIEKIDIYIKIQNRNNHGFVISFHETDEGGV